MTKLLVALFSLLAFLSWIAYLWQPKKDYQGKTPLIWVSDNNPTRTAQIEAFNSENPDLMLELDYGNSGLQKVIVQCSSGVGPDLFDYADQDQQTYVEAGVLWDVTEAAQKMGFSALANGWPTGANAALSQGRQYGYFANIGVPLLIYNKNVFDHFGVPYPSEKMTWDEFRELAARVNSATGNLDGTRNIHAVTAAGWRNYFESLRGEWFTEDGLPDVVSPEMLEAFQWHKDILYKYKLMPTSMELKTMSGQGGWGTGSLNSFASGHFAMIFTGDYALIAFRQAHQHQAQADPANAVADPLMRPLRLGATLLPHVAGREPSYQVLSRMTGINAMSERREEALRVLQYMAGSTYSGLINSGMDWLPGNPAHADLKVGEEHPDLARRQMHDATVRAMSYGYVPRQSPYLLTSDVSRVLQNQLGRMESDSSLEVRDLLETAQAELMTLLHRNLSREPHLQRRFEARTAAVQ